MAKDMIKAELLLSGTMVVPFIAMRIAQVNFTQVNLDYNNSFFV